MPSSVALDVPWRGIGIAAVFEKAVAADAGDTSQTIGAARSARATKIPKNLKSLPCSITEIPFTANKSNFNSAQRFVPRGNPTTTRASC